MQRQFCVQSHGGNREQRQIQEVFSGCFPSNANTAPCFQTASEVTENSFYHMGMREGDNLRGLAVVVEVEAAVAVVMVLVAMFK